MDYTKYRENVLSKGKKRILALDGGGIRGLFTVQLLKRLESIIRERTNDPNALLRDYFHLVGGTSTGAIIAGAIATGKTADELDTIYRDLGQSIFKSNPLRFGLFRSKFDSAPINAALDAHFDDMLIRDTTELGIGLSVVGKRMDTGSSWVVDNNPDGKYFSPEKGNNGNYSLKQVIRASTAAPVYFDPEYIPISDTQMGKFVDGGVSPHNNPALQMFMLATMKGYKYNWDKGEDNLFILSLGTGNWANKIPVHPDKFSLFHSAKNAILAVLSVMDDNQELNQCMMQWFGKATGPVRDIDRVIGNLESELLCDVPLFSYMRYDAMIDRSWLARELGITHFSDQQIERMRAMDALDTMDLLSEMGQKYAEKLIKPEHIL
ncbi:MAG: Patatin [uncultured Thiotrichaceae bacterium]|uniref:Patatin n=1 Tax=uncultured Thiotrichaceae bacterium TaxID=298394 RepID=A0A6S6U697_9GAMM|nr:MAG: Patatin [uncultured Thiotrichaceae bacterium]